MLLLYKICGVFIALILSPLILTVPQFQARAAEETGTVSWRRDFDTAFAASNKEKKPVFLLFQEVPGCSGCKQFGREVLSNPLLVEAIENLFIPVVVFNNQPGEDARLLNKFNETAWNYQVIRFLDENQQDIIPRRERIWTVQALAQRMIEALERYGNPVPFYLSSLVYSKDSNKLSVAYFSQFCFWTGEINYGRVDGVRITEAGFMDGREVTKVWYDPQEISLERLLMYSDQQKCADGAYLTRPELNSLSRLHLRRVHLEEVENYSMAPRSDQKRQLGSGADQLYLTDGQATKLNALSSQPGVAKSILSGEQYRLLLRLSNN